MINLGHGQNIFQTCTVATNI